MSSEWTQTTLGDVCLKITDGAHASPKTVATGKPMASVKDLTRFGVDLSSARLISVEDFENLVKQGCRPDVGDVLIAKDGNSALDTVCSVGSPLDAVLLSSVAILRPDPAKIDTDFLKFYLSSTDVIDYLKSTFISGAAIPRVVLRDFKKAEISIPPITSQRNITSVLNALENRIFLLRKTNATLEAIAQALFKSWFVDFDPVRAKMEGRVPEGMDEATAALFPDALVESELGLVPKGWHWGALSDLATFQNGYAFKSKDWADSGHPVVKIGDVKPGIIDLKGCSYVAHETVTGLDRFQLSRGDLLVGMTGYVGETGLVPAVEPAAYLNQRVGRMATRAGLADLGYIYCAARSPAFKEFAEAQSHGSAQANVSGASLMAFPAVIADWPQLGHFNKIVGGMLESILANHEQAQTLATLRDTLLPRLISGQLRLPEAQAEMD